MALKIDNRYSMSVLSGLPSERRNAIIGLSGSRSKEVTEIIIKPQNFHIPMLFLNVFKSLYKYRLFIQFVQLDKIPM